MFVCLCTLKGSSSCLQESKSSTSQFLIFFFQNQISSVLNFFREVFFLKVQLHGFACLFCKSEAKIDCLRISANFFLQNFCFANYFQFFFGITRWRAQRSRARVSRQAAKKPSVFFLLFSGRRISFFYLGILSRDIPR